MQSAAISLNEKQKTQGAPPPPHSGLYREATLEMGAFFKLAVYGVLKSKENCHFSIWKGQKIRCKVKEMAAKAKYMLSIPNCDRNNNTK